MLLAPLGANANTVLNTKDFSASIEAMTATMNVSDKQSFMTALAEYRMFKREAPDLSLSADALNARSYAEFDGLTAEQIMKAIKLSYQVEKQQSRLLAK